MSERCKIPLDGPSALHSALAEDGLLEEHIKVRHPEAQQVFSVPAAPVLTAEEIAQLRDDLAHVVQPETILLRLLATIAAKDREIAELRTDLAHIRSQAGQDSCADYVSRNEALQAQLLDANRRASELFDELGATVALESKLREAEEREAKLHEMRASIIDATRAALQAFNSNDNGRGFNAVHSIIWIIEAYEPAALQDAKELVCARCGQVKTASGGDVHCSGDCDSFEHDADGGCHAFVQDAKEK
jgi:hypothetical protein